MGRRRATKGIEVRRYASGLSSIRIHFVYRGVVCRETLKNIPVTAANLKYAANLKATIEHEITTGTFDYLARFPHSKKARKMGSPSLTLSAIADEYRAQVKQIYQPATIASYLQPLDHWIIPTFPMALRTIDAATIGRALKDLSLRGLKPKSVANYKTALNRILDYAVEQGYLPSNPALLVSAGRSTGRSEPVLSKIDPLTLDEVNAVLESATGGFKEYLRFAFYSGLRTSELYGLRWGDVGQQSVRVSRAVVHGKLKEPKTAAGVREVLLLPQARLALDTMQIEHATMDFPVFVNPITGTGFVRYKETAGRWGRVLRKAGVRYRNQYQTRHTYASHLLSGGENPYFVARQLGHANVAMVMRVYGRWIAQGEHVWVSDYGKSAA